MDQDCSRVNQSVDFDGRLFVFQIYWVNYSLYKVSAVHTHFEVVSLRDW